MCQSSDVFQYGSTLIYYYFLFFIQCFFFESSMSLPGATLEWACHSIVKVGDGDAVDDAISAGQDSFEVLLLLLQILLLLPAPWIGVVTTLPQKGGQLVVDDWRVITSTVGRFTTTPALGGACDSVDATPCWAFADACVPNVMTIYWSTIEHNQGVLSSSVVCLVQKWNRKQLRMWVLVKSNVLVFWYFSFYHVSCQFQNGRITINSAVSNPLTSVNMIMVN